jgi:hypothetical protein
MACTAAVAMLAFASPPSHAQAPPDAPTAGRDPAVEVKQVYKRPELDPYRDRTRLEYLGPKKQREPPAQRPFWGDIFGVAIGEIVRILAWAAVGLAIVFLLYHLLRRLDLFDRGPAVTAVRPATLFGLDVRPEALPQDLAAAAAELVRNGMILQALSLLYRGALSTLLHRDGMELAGGDTEADCLRKSRARVPEGAHRYFAQLLGAWQRAAYARRDVPRAEVETLCRDWPLHFGGKPAATGDAQ